MKKLLLISAALFLVCGCGNRQKKAAGDAGLQTENTVMAEDAHNAQTSLDYQGTYKGTIPAPEGDMVIKITLTDSAYEREMARADNPEDTKQTSGSFEWVGGNEILLDGLDMPDRFFVAENSIIVLDEQGRRIEGENAGKYVLSKIITETETVTE